MNRNPDFKVSFIPREKRPVEYRSTHRNRADKYARSLIRSEADRYCNTDLMEDYNKILNGGCYYLPNFFCETPDRTIFEEIKKDIENNNDHKFVPWSKHYKHENPEFSDTFNKIVQKMADHFDVEVCQTRLNYYEDGSQWKPMHHDRHAYQGIKEDFTMGASFGDTRALEFLHEKSNKKFKFVQNNGDVFSFNSEINKKFMHGVPKTFKKVGPRISIIAWGKARRAEP